MSLTLEKHIVTGGLNRTSRLPLAAILVVTMAALFLPLLFGIGQVPLLTGILLVLLFAYGWHPVGGILGEISLAHVIFWGAGAYATVFGQLAGLPFPVSVLLGVIAAVLLAAALVELISAARLDGLGVMIFTLVFLFFVSAIVRAVPMFGGTVGKAVSQLPLSVMQVYIIGILFFFVLLVINYLILNSRTGLVWLAIRDAPERVPSLGWSVGVQRRNAYLLTAALTAVGGSLSAASLGFVSPELTLSMHLILIPLLAVYVGGPGTLWGPFLGVLLLETLAAVAVANAHSPAAAHYIHLGQFLASLVIVMLALRYQKRSAADRIKSGAEYKHTHLLARLQSRQDIRSPARKNASKAVAGPLAVRNLHKAFGGISVLKGVSFEVKPGEVLGLVGPNGAGKSTLCNLIAGALNADTGSVTFGGTVVDKMRQEERARLGLGRTYQTPHAFTSLTITENVCIAGDSIGSAEAREALSTMGVSTPDILSGTATLFERRMIEMARLRVLAPKWVLLDEPLAGLSEQHYASLIATIRALADAGSCVLLIEHLVPIIAPICDRMIVLDGGGLISEGKPRDVLAEPAVIQAYLGAPMAVSGLSETYQ
jgi:ABC-type branched-subunit amino acid transport system ATPase component/ABC-type branched-subunit amino acid transport system permease subunit